MAIELKNLTDEIEMLLDLIDAEVRGQNPSLGMIKKLTIELDLKVAILYRDLKGTIAHVLGIIEKYEKEASHEEQ